MGSGVSLPENAEGEIESRVIHAIRNYLDAVRDLYRETCENDEDDDSEIKEILCEDSPQLSEYLQSMYLFALDELSGESSATSTATNGTEVNDIQSTEKDRQVHRLLTYRSPALLLQSYKSVDDETRRRFHSEILETVRAEKVEEHKLKMKAQKANAPADYSKSFGGTAEDTRKEAEAAALMRGDEKKDTSDGNDSRVLRPQYCTSHFDEKVLRTNGKWLRFDGGECIMYLNCLTKAIVSVRPTDYEEDEELNPQSTEEVVDLYNGLSTVTLTDLTTYVDEVTAPECNQKTLLLLDMSEEQNVRTFFSYKAIVEDVSALTIPFAKGGLKRGDLVERVRRSLVAAIKTGKIFCLYLGSMTAQHADWKKKMCKKDSFPVETFQLSGRKILEKYMGKFRYELCFREEDLEAGQAVARDGFKFIVVSSLSPFEYEENLKETIPLGYMQTTIVI